MNEMSSDALSLAAAALSGAIRSGTTLTGWPESIAPSTIDDAYRIQERVHSSLARALAGWKVGWTTRSLQDANGVSEPMTGRVPSETMVFSGATVRELRPANLKCEAELAFRLARALPPRNEPYSEQELADAIDVIFPAIEIVGSRFLDPPAAGRFSVVADNGAHSGLVLGAPIEVWRKLDRINLEARLYVDDVEVARGTGSNVLGDPLAPCVWLANWLSRRGLGLSAGDIVSSGSFLGAPAVPTGCNVVAYFGDHGHVAVKFVAH
ncbi:2-keto-4-pentenoate hydratase [Bradyrhizobium sp. USDA 4452]